MSVDIRIELAEPPPLRELIPHVYGPDLCFRLQAGRGEWPQAAILMHRHLVSTRCTEVNWEAGALEITIRPFAAGEDFDVALTLAAAIGEINETEIWMEGESGIPPRDLRARIDPRRWQSAMAAGMRRLIEREGTMQLAGPRRSWYVGPRVLAELDAVESELPFYYRATERMRRVQWIDELDGYTAAETLTGELAGRESTLAVWDPRDRVILPAVDLIAIQHSDDHAVVAAACIRDLAGSRASWLDEQQVLLEAMHEDEIERLFRAARRIAIDP